MSGNLQHAASGACVSSHDYIEGANDSRKNTRIQHNWEIPFKRAASLEWHAYDVVKLLECKKNKATSTPYANTVLTTPAARVTEATRRGATWVYTTHVCALSYDE